MKPDARPVPQRIRLACPKCGRALLLEGGTVPDLIRCGSCEEGIATMGRACLPGEAPVACLVCGSPSLYWQKDFSQKIGCAIVAVGAVLVPWTYGLSLAVVALIDFIMYQMLPRVSVCYVCKARYLGIPPHPEQRPYDLVTAQTYEARAENWADGKLRPAFRESIPSENPGTEESLV
jgi:hypothetical protein